MNWLQKVATEKKQAILIHGWEGGPSKNWFPWLSDKLSQLGYVVLNMSMPNPNSPRRSSWVKHLEDHISSDDKTIIVAHSIGCMAALRYLEKTSSIIRAMALVAPYTQNEHGYRTVKSFFTGDLKWNKIKKNCPKIYVIYSDDDPYVSTWQRLILEEKANAVSFLEKNQGHFDGDTLPKILEIIENL